MEENKEKLENMEIGEGDGEERKIAQPTTTPVINPAILEAFDGDLDDLMSFSSKVAEMEQSEKEASSEEEDDGIERQITADGRKVEWFNIRAEQESHTDREVVEEHNEVSDTDMQHNTEIQPDMGGEVDTNVQTNAGVQLNKEIQPDTGVQQLHGIDPNDPHYANYVPDMYYEYGVGPEPQRPSKQEMTEGVSGMAITSLCCGIASVTFFCCGYGFPQSIVGLVMGIITLSRKRPFDSNKVMALIGVILSGLSVLTFFGAIIWSLISAFI